MRPDDDQIEGQCHREMTPFQSDLHVMLCMIQDMCHKLHELIHSCMSKEEEEALNKLYDLESATDILETLN
jgi:hypothetical protein